MCTVCEVEGLDWKFSNGAISQTENPRTQLQKARLFRVYQDRVAVLKLCHLHSIELFLYGERAFLKSHPQMCIELGSKHKKYAINAA